MPTLASLLNAELVRCWWWPRADLDATLTWGCSRHGQRARRIASVMGKPCVAVEDGFLRSFRPGPRHPPLSVVVDTVGIHYDCTRPSELENLLAGDDDLIGGEMAKKVARARALILEFGLSKYNHAPALSCVESALGKRLLRVDDRRRVLVVDQTAGDLSITRGGASARTFGDMLHAAMSEHPDATVYVKSHPQALAGDKLGHFPNLHDGKRLVVLRQPIEPRSLLQHMDAVYVVSSTLGFEALLSGKRVHCFGLPWYAGWGVTLDRLRCSRRTRRRTVDELFAAAYLRYARYLNPDTHGCGSVFDVIDWLIRQRRMAGLLEEAHGR